MHRESYFTAGLLSWHLRWFRKPDNNNVAVTKENMVHPGGLLGCASPLRAVAYATLSSLVLAIISQTIKQHRRCYQGEYGASGRIRTSDRSVRSRVLYPAELRMHRDYCCNSDTKFRDLPFLLKNGASGRIRTSDRSVRSRVLYPAELRMHRETCFTTRQCHN